MEPRSTVRFRELLKAHREARRWSQERLAYEADMDHSQKTAFQCGKWYTSG